MASPATVASAIETKVLASTSATAALANPLSTDEALAAGATKIRRPAFAIGRIRSSNDTDVLIAVDVEVVHMLADSTDEATYLEGDALTDQAVLMDSEFFRTVAGVEEVIDPPELTKPVRERPGNVIVYAVSVQLQIVT